MNTPRMKILNDVIKNIKRLINYREWNKSPLIGKLLNFSTLASLHNSKNALELSFETFGIYILLLTVDKCFDQRYQTKQNADFSQQ